MAELVDALDLGSSAARRGGSSPFTRTIIPYLIFINQIDRGSVVFFGPPLIIRFRTITCLD